MIEIKNIEKSFGENKVLKNVNMTFKKGQTNLIIGESGSGKTTLIKILIGLYKNYSGKVLFDGSNVSEMNKKELKKLRQDIGMLFQGGALYDYMSVEENIIFPLSLFTDKSEKEKMERVNFCLERVNLKGKNNLMPSELSGGMKKRVAIARAIVMQPKYLFCDEPNSGLDPKTAILIDDLIMEITKEYNITTIVNTHDMNSVMQIGDNISFIHKGEMWWKGNKEELIVSNNEELTNFVFASKLFKRLKK
ncbi:MAG: ATP-binding cassette domain-containing protein [Flavobacteriales bacterium]|jgi:phospholipid/cholesterol/gamma-HCH transport system ATP-binding protein|nr:ATP-binding cassette domain-containing protein [Flavobacteriales bacterium]MDC1069177.1 ATP-binding cassette domain-containing protein [Flavobacteriales bacterium]|tara:strand:- start:701 stop:1447 length:747 start_codon:yes stop_codon:yes gene_type:complete